jgi:folate-binding protein YgfZ
MGEQRTAPAQVDELASLQVRMGSVVGTIDEGGPVVPLRYGSVVEEYGALRQGCGLVDRSSAGRLEMTGADRLRFLNAYVTCEVKSLAPGAGAYGFATSPQGRILTDLTVLAFEDRLWLDLPPGQAGPLAAHLRKFLIADRVEMRELAEVVPLSLFGPRAEAVLAAAVSGQGEAVAASGRSASMPGLTSNTGALMPAAPHAHVRGAVAGLEVTVQRGPRLGAPGFTLWVASDAAAALVSELLARPGVVAVGFEALEALRVEAGVPRFGRDFGVGGGGGGGGASGGGGLAPQSFPQETGIEEAVSYTKGCYLGQEVVARIHYRGGVQKGLRGLVFSGAAPPAGTPLLFAGREAGVATSVVSSPALGLPIGLSILHRRAAATGTRLAWSRDDQSGEAEVRDLPLVAPA